MRFSYHPTMCDPSFYLELGKAAEAAGFNAITFPDSICYPKECDSTYPYNDDGSREFLDGVPFLEPFSIIPAIAAVTDKLEFRVFEISARIVAGSNPFVSGSSYSDINEKGMSTGRRISRCIKKAIETGNLNRILS